MVIFYKKFLWQKLLKAFKKSKNHKNWKKNSKDFNVLSKNMTFSGMLLNIFQKYDINT